MENLKAEKRKKYRGPSRKKKENNRVNQSRLDSNLTLTNFCIPKVTPLSMPETRKQISFVSQWVTKKYDTVAELAILVPFLYYTFLRQSIYKLNRYMEGEERIFLTYIEVNITCLIMCS